MVDPAAMATAVVAQTKERARRIAREFGLDTRWIFGATDAAIFEGIRANLVLIDADAKISTQFLGTIRATVLKMPGGGGTVRWVSDREPGFEELTEYRRDHYDEHRAAHRVDQADVRCFRPFCDLRYAERDQYGCPAGLDGHGTHRYDDEELAAALVCDDPIHQYANQFEEAGDA